MSSLITKAQEFATTEHQRINHVRKYSNLPYQTHLQAVAKLVSTVTDDEEMIAAAWLHDTVEDTPATLGDIEKAFGIHVAELVEELTDVSKPSDGNRATRKEIDRQHLATASRRAKTIKLADLIHNCADIVKNDEKFARTFISEMKALLEVLSTGDKTLFKRAQNLISKSSEKLGIDPSIERLVEPVNSVLLNLIGFSDLHFKDKYLQLFTARDVAESLLSFDSDALIDEADKAFNYHRQSVASIRINGRVQGYVKQSRLKGEVCGDSMRHFTVDQVIRGTASLSDVIHVLTRHDFCFVNIFGEVTGVVTREDINKPQVRMWLFGLVTMIETSITELIDRVYPDEAWKQIMSKGRLEKMEEIWSERKRRNLHCQLIECLQFSDKAGILITDKASLEQMGFETGKQAKKVIKELESLRNHLAHSQDIVSHDWAQIARLVNRLS
ncbi:MAG: bifunctional (p)ppGpp synthetase/guanosine-3',5'-bis(diphosphate) 3'-pyrophosphohydrolase [endosymbiont of Galathealinum brachiosum]|uniref:Bifunctional (P)ppGpp synthetase/guanosine-3',5'-bis(Diphosphate) 3'-pyrophosphohydrolase n=1 Tax=endosymbiont of Galathealinum brachiosum TaxID=2200906 RepID=A0A370DCU7_9GAMM|nr:MAG: bifunctional (p)ppGpp synthetase/guanosine-3',5'-bis(diphosphate) 3'-pyrophosphohydrolase [endosymbiont of Galathealinum brachiosum]